MTSVLSKVSQYAVVLIILFALLFLAEIVASWTGPTGTPPNNNVPAPVNVGTVDQVKDAGLGLDSLAVFGNAIMSGNNRYINFGTTVGANGYGIRDNNGTIECKNKGGSWAPCGGGSSQTTSGTLVGGGSVSCNNTSTSNRQSYSCSGTCWGVATCTGSSAYSSNSAEAGVVQCPSGTRREGGNGVYHCLTAN